jgi:hypothetical protein
MNRYRNEDEYEPTEEEWADIEELLMEEEEELRKSQKEEHDYELIPFIKWCKENGILWEKGAGNVGRRKK